MNINAYIEKLRRKPAKERERIAIVATGVAFAVIFVIWLVSFSEMNRGSADQTDSGAVSTQAQFNDLKNDFGQSKQSIQDMLQQMPASPSLGGPNQQDLNSAFQSPDQSGSAGTDSTGGGADSSNLTGGDNSNTDTPGAPSIQDLQTAPDSGNGGSSTDNNNNQSGSNTNPSGTAQPPSNPSGGGNNPGAGSIPALP